MDRTTDNEIKAGAAPVSFNEVEKLTEAKYTIQKYKRILFYVVICVLLAAFILGQYIYPSEREPVTEESITYTEPFTGYWQTERKKSFGFRVGIMCLPESL